MSDDEVKSATPSPEIDMTASEPDTKAPTPKPNTFQTALQTWTEIDLSTLQKKLDEQGIELKDEQKLSLLSRKNLASQTKEFRKLPDESKLQEFKSLLKLYQNEIDSLTNKLKKAENYFFGFYRLIAEAPDPRPLLELSLDAVIESTGISNLKKEINRLNEELSKKADYEQLKQRLLRNEQKSAELLASKLNAKEEEFKALIDEKESNWTIKEKEYESQLKNFKTKIEELRTSKEVTELQLNEQNKQIGGDNTNASASILAELEIISRDYETSKKRVFDLEKRNESLRRELSKSQNDADRQQLKEESTKKISELEGENALLVAQINQMRQTAGLNSQNNNNKIESLNREISQLSIEIKNLKGKIEETSDYDEIKHELYLLRQIEFGQDEDDNEEGTDRQIDALLIEKNKSLTKELTTYRSSFDDLNSRIASLEAELKTTGEELSKCQQLNYKLENDMADLQEAGSSNKFNDNMSLISSVTRMTRPMREDNLTEESSILPIITKQRDRFREKNKELEDEIRKQYTIISDLKRQMNSLRSDNEELYERTRYLASFKNNNHNNMFTPVASQSFGARTSNRKLLQTTASTSPSVDLERNSAYQESYESKLHPIEQFRMREQERISSRLSPIERLFISVTRAVLATRTTRMLFLGYCLGLHCVVVFVTVYAMNLSTRLIPEVGLKGSTGGVAIGLSGSPEVIQNVHEAAP